MIHCIYLGVTGFTFQMVLYFILWRYFVSTNSAGPGEMTARVTLENHCTRTAQSEHGCCSRRVHKIVYLAVNKGNIWSIFYFLKY